MSIEKNDRSLSHCFLIQEAIENDDELVFKKFFEKQFVEENYNFLKASYKVLKSDTADFNKLLIQLNKQFIVKQSPDGNEMNSNDIINFDQIEKRSDEINISHDIRSRYMTNFDHYVEGELKEDQMRLVLSDLVKNIHGLVYQNMIDIDDFNTYISQYKPQEPTNGCPPDSNSCCSLL